MDILPLGELRVYFTGGEGVGRHSHQRELRRHVVRTSHHSHPLQDEGAQSNVYTRGFVFTKY
jgi:hypothetical protein